MDEGGKFAWEKMSKISNHHRKKCGCVGLVLKRAEEEKKEESSLMRKKQDARGKVIRREVVNYWLENIISHSPKSLYLALSPSLSCSLIDVE